MAIIDAVFIFGDFFGDQNAQFNAAAPAGDLPRLQVADIGDVSTDYGDFFVAGLVGGILAAERRNQALAALATFVAAQLFNQLFLVVDSLPGTVPAGARPARLRGPEPAVRGRGVDSVACACSCWPSQYSRSGRPRRTAAELGVAIDRSPDRVVTFAVDRPGTALSGPTTITGIVAAGEDPVAIDFRPSTGELYMLAVDNAGRHRAHLQARPDHRRRHGRRGCAAGHGGGLLGHRLRPGRRPLSRACHRPRRAEDASNLRPRHRHRGPERHPPGVRARRPIDRQLRGCRRVHEQRAGSDQHDDVRDEQLGAGADGLPQRESGLCRHRQADHDRRDSSRTPSPVIASRSTSRARPGGRTPP